MPRLLPARKSAEGVQLWIAPHVKGPRVARELSPELEDALEKLDNGEKLPPLLVSPSGYVVGTLENLWTWEVLLASQTSVYAVEIVPLTLTEEADVLDLIYSINEQQDFGELEEAEGRRRRVQRAVRPLTPEFAAHLLPDEDEETEEAEEEEELEPPYLPFPAPEEEF